MTEELNQTPDKLVNVSELRKGDKIVIDLDEPGSRGYRTIYKIKFENQFNKVWIAFVERDVKQLVVTYQDTFWVKTK